MKRTRDFERLAALRELGCLICGSFFVEIHHLRHGLGLGMRAGDDRAIPLCVVHHRTGGFGVAIHGGAKEFRRLHGTDEELLERTNKKLEEK